MAYPTLKEVNDNYQSNEKKANRDPITGKPGSHPVATGIGAAVGVTAGVVASAAMGAATGAAFGPVGALAGAAAGGILGGGVGHGIGEDIHPTQLAWWKENYTSRAYADPKLNFAEYEPAYRVGIDAALQNQGQDFEDLEPSLRNNWNIARGKSSLDWNDAKHASRDAFIRLNSSDI